LPSCCENGTKKSVIRKAGKQEICFPSWLRRAFFYPTRRQKADS
jgi:hypothetical protein